MKNENIGSYLIALSSLILMGGFFASEYYFYVGIASLVLLIGGLNIDKNITKFKKWVNIGLGYLFLLNVGSIVLSICDPLQSSFWRDLINIFNNADIVINIFIFFAIISNYNNMLMKCNAIFLKQLGYITFVLKSLKFISVSLSDWLQLSVNVVNYVTTLGLTIEIIFIFYIVLSNYVITKNEN